MCPFRQLVEGRVVETIEKLRIDFAHARDHFADHGARLGGRIGSGVHAPEAVQHDARKRVHHGGRRGDRQNIARHFDGALFGLALDFFHAPGVGHRLTCQMSPRICARVVLEERSQFAIRVPGAGDGALENFRSRRDKLLDVRRNIGQGAVEPHVALALLLGIIKRMRVQERPDELAADVFEAELKMRVLVDGVVAGVESRRADGGALLLGDFVGRDQARRVAGARRGDGRVVRMREGIAQRDARQRRLKQTGDARSGSCEADGEGVAMLREDSTPPACAGTARRRTAYFFLGLARPPRLPPPFRTCALKRSTRPAVSISFCLPVKKGWQLEQISTRTRSPLKVERVLKALPQAQWTVTSW